MIAGFFQPFFAGIFLEEKLHTSSRMFEFIYKMFSKGHAAIPRKGMQAIPDQLTSQLNKTNIRLNSQVKHIKDKTITLDSGEKIIADNIVIATDPSLFLENHKKSQVKWKTCHNIYFSSSHNTFGDPIISLIPGKGISINNIHFLDDLFESTTNTKQTILSTTVVKDHELTEEEMVLQVQKELREYCNIETDEVLHIFHIKKALPMLQDLKYEPTLESATLSADIFCCGDHLANGSLNAAMASGRIAAELVISNNSY